MAGWNGYGASSVQACGCNGHGQYYFPPLDGGRIYTEAAAGDDHTILLSSTGTAVACGYNDHGQCILPALIKWRSELFIFVPNICPSVDRLPG